MYSHMSDHKVKKLLFYYGIIPLENRKPDHATKNLLEHNLMTNYSVVLNPRSHE